MSAQGHTKPCIYSGCSGTMQFAQEPVQGRGDALGWVCDTTAKHFHRPLAGRDSAVQPAAKSGAASWVDDGGTVEDESK